MFAFIVADFATAVALVTLNENHLYHMQIRSDATEQRVLYFCVDLLRVEMQWRQYQQQ